MSQGEMRNRRGERGGRGRPGNVSTKWRVKGRQRGEIDIFGGEREGIVGRVWIAQPMIAVGVVANELLKPAKASTSCPLTTSSRLGVDAPLDEPDPDE